ncbi:MAG: hypothetical protein AUG80_09820 [Candidatus Rokubacteria bacterium 13_1_20CM_4_68_9]|nr:MAG: hypothetical protein AUG80_09820 [Candidatus Rokubacteria bacterium 13_1_20CM_4_68_9]
MSTASAPLSPSASPSRAASLTLAWRFAAFHVGGFPVLPTLILLVLAFTAVFANVIAPSDPEIGTLGERFRPPAWQTGGSERYLLGTDHLGRDVLSRLIFGARVSMVVGLTAVLFAGAVGTALGILSGFLGGWVDQVIMRVTDTWLALPALTFAIFLAAVVGPSEMNIVIILGAVYWTRYARVIRGEVLEAALSFLGVGVPPPKPAWGLMLADGKKGLMAGYWWLTVLPGSCIMLMVLSANLLGDWLRVKLAPQLRQL